MEQIIKHLILSIALVSCSNPPSRNSHDDFQTWLNDNRLPPNERLIDFYYQSGNGPNHERHKIEKTIRGDTLIASFYSTQPVGCLLIGDIEILENLVVLKFGQACNPYGEGIATEEADLLFTYKVKNGVGLQGVPFKIEELAHLLK